MNTKLNTLASVIAVALLSACGGSGDDSGTSAPATAQANFANDAQAQSDAASISLAGTPGVSAAYDLVIGQVTAPASLGSDGTGDFGFSVANLGSSAVPADSLSVALELSASGNFGNSYRTALFDIRTDNAGSSNAAFTARSAPIDLPSGTYNARLIVNPNWQYAFDTVPADHSHGDAYRYVQETDFSNNATDAFQVQVQSSMACAEDGFEDNNTVQTAYPIPPGGQISSSLCLDNVDIYAMQLGAGESASLSFDYTDTQSNNNPATRYVLLDSNWNTHSAPRVARETSSIVVDADDSGTYYLALFGQRSSYRITRSGGNNSGLANDYIDSNVFTGGTLNGPQSWLLGDITLQKLQLTEEKVTDQVINCGRITTQYSGDAPVAYVTPSHFADIHEFRFQPGGDYLIDAEQESGWSIANGDISNPDWYANDYPGYAERLSNNQWRYWSQDGLAYVECTLEVN